MVQISRLRVTFSSDIVNLGVVCLRHMPAISSRMLPLDGLRPAYRPTIPLRGYGYRLGCCGLMDICHGASNLVCAV